MKDMNDLDICAIFNDGEFDTFDRKVLNFILNYPIEKIHDGELRAIAIATRQSLEILSSKLTDMIKAQINQKTEHLD